MSSEHAPYGEIVAGNLLCSPSTLCRHIGLLFGERLDTLFTSWDKKISGFTRPDVIGFVADLFFFHSGEQIYFFPDSLSNSPDTDIFESATFSFRIRLPSTRIRRIRQRIRKKINPFSRVEKNKSATNPITCALVNPDIFLSDGAKSVSSLSPNNKPIWRHNVEGEQSKFPATISLYSACSEDILMQRSFGY